MLVALARIAGCPNATREGKEIRLPPPATELTMPATSAATKRPSKPNALIRALSRTSLRGRRRFAAAGPSSVLRPNRCRRVAYNGSANALRPLWLVSPNRRGNPRSRGGRTDAQVAGPGRSGRCGVPRPGGAAGNATRPAGRAGRSACRPGQPVLRRVDDAVRRAAVRRDRNRALPARLQGRDRPRTRGGRRDPEEPRGTDVRQHGRGARRRRRVPRPGPDRVLRPAVGGDQRSAAGGRQGRGAAARRSGRRHQPRPGAVRASQGRCGRSATAPA